MPLSLMATDSFAKQAEQKVEKRPNLLIIMADQWRGRALGFMGEESVLTPNLDRLAQSGVSMCQAVSGYPVSSPARAMLMSGAYPHNNGVTGNCNSQTTPQNVELRQDIVCWSDVLKAEGYRTGYIGKWHLDKLREPWIDCSNNKGSVAWNEWCEPSRRHGFDFWTAYGTYDRHLRPMYWNTDSPREGFYYVDQWGPEHEADLAIGFLDDQSRSKEPFALMVSMNPPHTGYSLVPDRYKKLYEGLNVDSIATSWGNASELNPKMAKYLRSSLADYYACMSGVDEQVGRIIDKLKATAEWDNTIVVFTSDHGDMMGIHNRIGKNIFYEEAMRVPMIIAYGDRLNRRGVDDLLISLEDLYPTLMGMMGLEDRVPSSVQTRDLSAQVMGSKKSRPKSQLYMHYSEDEAAVISHRDGRRGLRGPRYTYAERAARGRVVERELYDRLVDPFQMENLSNRKPEIARTMARDLRLRLKAIGDRWVENESI